MSVGEVLQFMGTVLIAYELLGRLSHVIALPILVAVNRVHGLRTRFGFKRDRSRPVPVDCVRFLRHLFLMGTVLVASVLLLILSLLVVPVWFVGQFPRVIDETLNHAYQQQLIPWEDKVVSAVARLARASPSQSARKVTNADARRAMHGVRVPFTGIVGLLAYVVGFVAQVFGM